MKPAPFADEDHAFRVYARSMSRSGISGLDPIAMRGVEWAKRCRCGSESWKKQDGVERCRGFRCGRARPWKMIGVTRGYFQENTRRHSGNWRMEQVADLGVVFKALTLWETRVWWAYIALGSYQRAFHFCRKAWPRREAGWSLHQVKRITDEARDRVRPKLERRGWI